MRVVESETVTITVEKPMMEGPDGILVLTMVFDSTDVTDLADVKIVELPG